MEDYIYNLSIFAYITGSAALIIGFGALATKKGRVSHRTFGKLFFLLMMVSSVTIGVAGYYYKSDILQLTSIGTVYMGLSGVRSLKMKRPDKGASHKPKALDWLMLLTFGVAYSYFIYTGFFTHKYLSEVNSLVAAVLMSFAVFDLYLFTRAFNKLTHRLSWMYKHLTRMILCHALLATSMIGLWLIGEIHYTWLAPIIVMGAVMTLFFRHYQLKYQG